MTRVSVPRAPLFNHSPAGGYFVRKVQRLVDFLTRAVALHLYDYVSVAEVCSGLTSSIMASNIAESPTPSTLRPSSGFQAVGSNLFL